MVTQKAQPKLVHYKFVESLLSFHMFLCKFVKKILLLLFMTVLVWDLNKCIKL